MATQEYLTVYSNMSEANPLKGSAHQLIEQTAIRTEGNFTATVSGIVFVPDFAGEIVNIIGALLENGADGTDPMNTTFTVKKGATSVSTTDAKLDKTAGTGIKSTYATATGITKVVLKTDGSQKFAAGDVINYTATLVRTTPETEAAGMSITIYYKRLKL